MIDVISRQPDGGDDRRADRDRTGIAGTLFVLPRNVALHLAHPGNIGEDEAKVIHESRTDVSPLLIY